ncbi:allophycocyanin subunit alpha-B [Leptolyngbya sp. AN03gr2]|uniref:allophycocyanin subunit alpha-B n=1 Tax=unclassified Leptolyngbya TaxID=2650499 RepID=UPI003D313338
MSIVTQSIAAADREARYLSLGELQAIKDFFETGQYRLQIAMILTEKESYIVDHASLRFWERCRVTPSNSGIPRFRASCMRDQAWYLRLVTYAIVADDVEPIRTIGTKGARTMYDSLGVPIQNVVECMRCLKEVSLSLLSIEDRQTIAPYFDYLIQGLQL